MDKTKIVTLTLLGLLAFSTSLAVTKIYFRKAKAVSDVEGKTKVSYAIHFLSWLICFSILNMKIMAVMNEYLDSILKTNLPNPIPEIAKTASIFIGLSNVWLIFLHYMTKIFSSFFTGKRNELMEIENNHYVYYLIRGSIFVGLVYCLMQVYEMLIRFFLPAIEFSFYR
jgi:hypothetical protein